MALLPVATIFIGTPTALATGSHVPTGSIGLYMDSPFVQGSYANTPSAATETFDSLQVDPISNTKLCESTNAIAVGQLLPTCTIHGPNSPAADAYSASTSQGSEMVGGNQSGFLTSYPGGGYSITFSEQKKYVGFWWATASTGNVVRFYSNSSLVAEIDINSVNSLVGSAPANDAAYASDTSTVTSIGGTQYFKKYYFGNPRHYPVGSPNPPSAVVGSEAFVYLHAFAGDGVGFNRVEFATYFSGFEIDNLTTSSEAVDINPRLVEVGTVAAQGTYEGIAPVSGSGANWINLKGTQLARTGASDAGYQTVYWKGKELGGSWTGPVDLISSGGSIRTHSTDTSIDVLLPSNTYTHVIFWIDWCSNYSAPSGCVPLHFGETNLGVTDSNYRFRKTRSITYLTSGSGTIQGDSLQTVTYGDDGTSVTAVPAAGAEFIKWSDDLADPPVIPATRTSLSVTSDIELTAVFSLAPSQSSSSQQSSPTNLVQVFEVTGFAFEKFNLEKSVKINLKQITNYFQSNFAGIITCQGQTGFNWNKRTDKFLTSVANKRAKNSCSYFKSKFPKAQIKILNALRSNSLQSEARKVLVNFVM